MQMIHAACFFLFFFSDTATTEIYTLSLHDALPISGWDFWSLAISGLARFTSPTEAQWRSEEHTSELQSHSDLVCRLLLEKKNDASFFACSNRWRTLDGATPTNIPTKSEHEMKKKQT